MRTLIFCLGGVMTAVLVQAVLLVFIMVALIILASTANIKQSSTVQGRHSSVIWIQLS